MPIERSICIQNVSKEVFDVRDKIVMRCAYDAQNALGRLCDEKVYETDLTRRLRAVDFRKVHTQVPVRVVHGDFQKENSICLSIIRLSIIRLSKERDKPRTT